MNKRIKKTLRNIIPTYLLAIGLNMGVNGVCWHLTRDSINSIDRKMASGEAGFEVGESRYQATMSLRQVWVESLGHARFGTIGPRVLIPGDFVYTFVKNHRDLSALM